MTDDEVVAIAAEALVQETEAWLSRPVGPLYYDRASDSWTDRYGRAISVELDADGFVIHETVELS